MRSIQFLLCVLLVGPNFSSASNQPTRLEFVGTFSAFRQTPDHVYGYALTLWTDDGVAHALWARARGEPADFPLVQVTDLSWNRHSGAIQFTARWCDGNEVFQGFVSANVRGTVNVQGRSETVVLEREDTASMGPDLRSRWTAFVADELKRRGPKC